MRSARRSRVLTACPAWRWRPVVFGRAAQTVPARRKVPSNNRGTGQSAGNERLDEPVDLSVVGRIPRRESQYHTQADAISDSPIAASTTVGFVALDDPGATADPLAGVAWSVVS